MVLLAAASVYRVLSACRCGRSAGTCDGAHTLEAPWLIISTLMPSSMST